MCSENKKHKLYTLVFIEKESEILLGMKKRGFRKGKWNGFGGKVDSGETIEQAAHRELREECDISTENIRKVGILNFEFEGNPVIMEVHVFRSKTFQGTPTESEEMRPKWFQVEDIPFDQMWLDDQYWWPYFLKNQSFIGYFMYRGYDTILSYNIKTVDKFV